MPKVSRAKKAYKAAERQEQASKTINFTFEHRKHSCTIHRHNSASDIHSTIRHEIGILDEITITDSKGHAIVAHFKSLHHDMNIHVHRKPAGAQGAKVPNRAATKTQELLVRIIGHWDLDHPVDILDEDTAPRNMNPAGKRVTKFDDDTRLLNPSEWSAKFTAALCDLSKKSIGKHAEAMRELEQARRERVDRGIPGQDSAQVTTIDCKVAAAKMEKQIRSLAEAAMDVVDTETFVGGIGPALEGVENEIETEKFVGGIGEALKDAEDDDEL